ncbi:glycoside hydrolase family 3 protein [Streptococcus moroccensis]|uniref:Beta-glucosidase n=1 Tax=Streptococcus moroccensis TaxID=1451356 RepID=A0ABT9YPB4_9STRE|nr:glycoside hydrolase family 3 protein [Streptococcus moroccensis]MDQ0221833.1 beta-glucosidase [Streptococcus moroccensis]
MSEFDFLASIPRGKDDKPFLLSFGEVIYNFNDIDGLYTMLDKDFSGCIIFNFSKDMNSDRVGSVEVDGVPVTNIYLKKLAVMGNMWALAVKVRGLISEYDRTYTLTIKDFVDTDGNTMEPQDIEVKTPPQVYPEERFEEHESIAYQVAQEGIVLLENKEGILPLASQQTINLFGKGIFQFRVGAVGAGKINPRYIKNIVDAIKEDNDYQLNENLIEFYRCDEDKLPPQNLLDEAKELSNTAIMLITRSSGENIDNTTEKGEYYLSEEEDTLLSKLSETFENVIVILNVGYPIYTGFVQKYGIKGLVYSGYGGMLGGPALWDTLTGKVAPSGKLTDTWANYLDIPSSQNFYDAAGVERLDANSQQYINTVYEEDIYVGYRYFDTFNKPVEYPFGYGLTYTSFEIESKQLNFNPKIGLELEVEVTNTGQDSGKEVVQVYIGHPRNNLEKPKKILVAFEKTSCLFAKEKEQVVFNIPLQHMMLYNPEESAYMLEAGTFTVYLGNDVNATEIGAFCVEKDTILRKVEHLMTPPIEFTLLSQNEPEQSYPQGKLSGITDEEDFSYLTPRRQYKPKFSGKKPNQKLTYQDVKENPQLVEDFVAQFSVEELARLSICGSAGWGMEGIGEAGHVVGIEGYDFPELLVADGNSGVNIHATNIGMPSSVTVSSSFNKELSQEVGKVIGLEAKSLGIPLILAPAFNIHRNPLNGRHPEYYSEDPYQAGMMAGYYAKGMESVGVATSMKHLIANNCESSRKRNHSILSERAIRDIYFKVFELAMEVQMPASIMTAYNACNGSPTASDSELIQGLLRREIGFDGFVMTDWTTYDTVPIVDMIKAGNTWITPGSLDETYTSQIIDAVNNGNLNLLQLQENVSWLIKTMIRYV